MGYSSDQTCKVKVGSDPGKINVETFDTEIGWDKLKVNGQEYDGEEGPKDVVPQGEIEWNSDGSVEYKGFKLCLPELGNPSECDEAMGDSQGTGYRGCQTKTVSGA